MRTLYILPVLIFMGCTDQSKLYVNSVPPKGTHVLNEPILVHEKPYDESMSYRNSFGDDFGYFDSRGYYCNGRFYLFNDTYRYNDRVYHRGYFRPNVRHVRVYEGHESGNGYYYPAVPKSHIKKRVIHPEYLEEGYVGSGSYSNLSYGRE